MLRLTALLITVAAALAGVLAFAGRHGAIQAAIRDGGPNLALVIQANRYSVRPGQPVSLAAGFLNRGDETLRLRLSCAPPVDFEVRGPDGAVVWSQASDCASDDRLLTLAPGAQRLWEAQWPGREGLGEYTAYAVLHTLPREAVAGPLTITVSDADEPPPTDRPRETDAPRATDGPRPTEQPQPTSAVDFPDGIFPVANRDGTEREPDVDGRREAGDCQDLVVWLDEAQHGIFGRFVAGAWRGEPFRISGEDNPATPAKLAYNPVRRLWLVVWSARRDAGDLELRARYVQCGGLEGAVFTIGSNAADDTMPAVAAAGEAFGVAWLRSGPDQRVIRAARVVGLDTTNEIALADGAASEPAVACRGGESCVVVWTSGAEEGREIRGRRWRITEAQFDDILEVANSAAMEYDASIAAGDGDRPYLVTWTRAGDATRVWARRVAASGVMLVGDDFPVSGDGTADHGDVSAAAEGFNVVWSDRNPDAAATVRGRYVQVGEGVQLGAIQTVSDPEAPVDLYPAAASTASRVALAVWQAGGDDNGDILGRFVRWPGDAPSRVALFGRVVGAGAMALSAGHLDVDVERVVDGSFACPQARVDYGDETPLPSDLKAGDHVYVVGDVVPGAPPCALTVSAPGTMIMSLGPLRLFTPIVLKR